MKIKSGRNGKRQQDILLKQQNSVAKEEKVGFSDPDEEALNKID